MKYTVITICKSMLIGAIFTATLAAGTAAHAAYGVDFAAVPTTLTENGDAAATAAQPYTVVGWSFRADKDLYLTRLGVYDADKERRHSEQHYVGIWNASNTASALGSVIINESSATTPEFNQGALFHFGSLDAPLLLKAGQIYHVGATLYSGTASTSGNYDMFASINPDDNHPVTVNSDITYLSGVYGLTNTSGQLVFPGTVDTFATYTIGANIDVTPTPIPAAAWLLGSGLLGLVGIRRRQK